MGCHYLVKVTLPARLLAWALLVALAFMASAPPLALALLPLPWAALVVAVQRFYANNASGARAGLLADALAAPLMLAAVAASTWLYLVALAFLLMSMALIASWRWVLVAATCFTALTVFLVPTGGLQIQPAQAAGLLLVMVYAVVIASLGYRSSGLIGARGKATMGSNLALRQEVASLKPYIAVPVVTPTRRQHAVVFFSDLAGFTAVMDRCPESEVTQHLNEYLALMADIALAHGATIDKFMGDGMMILFGAPATRGRQGDVAACLRMALAMRAAFADLQLAWQASLGATIDLRIGIHAGYCAVGSFGCRHRLEFTALGGVVNLASRLETAAAPGTILVSSAVGALAGERFAFSTSRRVTLKGISGTVAVQELLGVQALTPAPAARAVMWSAGAGPHV